MTTLKDLCVNTIIKKNIDYDNTKLVNELVSEIDLLKHKNNMKKTFGYFNHIQKWISDKQNISIKNVRYLPSQDFFSYDHLIIRYSTTPGSSSFKFIQI
jgi:hypothetical protein